MTLEKERIPNRYHAARNLFVKPASRPEGPPSKAVEMDFFVLIIGGHHEGDGNDEKLIPRMARPVLSMFRFYDGNPKKKENFFCKLRA